MMIKKIINKTTILFIIIVFVVSYLTMINSFILALGDEIQNINYAIELQNNINKKNLSLPFPNITNVNLSNSDYKTFIYNQNFNKNLTEFHKVLKENYIYSYNEYDCKYWAFVWTLYFKENKEKYNWRLKYITTQNHIVVMVYNEKGYIVLDGDDIIIMGKI